MRLHHRYAWPLLLLAAILFFCACGSQIAEEDCAELMVPEASIPTPDVQKTGDDSEPQAESEQEQKPVIAPSDASAPAETADIQAEQNKQFLIVIDPGHQMHGDNGLEPIGPGAFEQKARVSSGTVGAFTGTPEYELTLAVSILLRDELAERGYDVVLTHETADISMSNAERAEFANNLNADVFLRIHANGAEDSFRHGAMTICMTKDNPYHPEMYEQSRALSEAVLDALCAASGAEKEYVWETDSMSGINYCEVPTSIVEMGYLTNEDEDRLLSTPEYRNSIVDGIADGIDAFLGGKD